MELHKCTACAIPLLRTLPRRATMLGENEVDEVSKREIAPARSDDNRRLSSGFETQPTQHYDQMDGKALADALDKSLQGCPSAEEIE